VKQNKTQLSSTYLSASGSGTMQVYDDPSPCFCNRSLKKLYFIRQPLNVTRKQEELCGK